MPGINKSIMDIRLGIEDEFDLLCIVLEDKHNIVKDRILNPKTNREKRIRQIIAYIIQYEIKPSLPYRAKEINIFFGLSFKSTFLNLAVKNIEDSMFTEDEFNDIRISLTEGYKTIEIN